MPFKWLLAIIAIWLGLSFLGGAMDNAPMTIVNDSGQTVSSATALNVFTTPLANFSLSSVIGAITDGNWWRAAGDLFTLNFPSLFTGAGLYLRWLILGALGAAFAITLLLAGVRGTPSS
jgi:hypothetical protein